MSRHWTGHFAHETSFKAPDLEAGITRPILLGLLKLRGRKVKHFSRVTQPRRGPNPNFPDSTPQALPQVQAH